jgi:hypothetical protein
LSYAPKGKLPAGVCLIIIGTEGIAAKVFHQTIIKWVPFDLYTAPCKRHSQKASNCLNKSHFLND